MSGDLDRRRQLISAVSKFGADASASDEDLKQFKRELKSFVDVQSDDELQDLSKNQLLIVGLLKLLGAQESSKARIQARTLRAISKTLGVAECDNLKDILTQFAAKFGVSDAENIYDDIRALSRVIPRIVAEFGLTGNFDASSVGDLCNAIRRKCRKEPSSSAFARKAAAVLGLPETASEAEILSALAVSRERMEDVEDEVADMKQTIVELRKQLRQIRNEGEEKLKKSADKMKKSSAQMRQQLKDAEAETARWKDKCRDLEIRCDACESERADLEQRNQAMRSQITRAESPDTTDFGNIMGLAEQLKTQFENQSEELMDEARTRKLLVTIVNKQSALMKAYEDQVRQAARDLEAAKREAAVLVEQKLAAQRQEPVVTEEDLREAVVGAVADAPLEISDMICSTLERGRKGSLTERIAYVVGALVDEIGHIAEEKEALENNNVSDDVVQRLMGILNTQLKFMEKLVGSEDERKLVFGQEKEQTAKDMLLVEVARTHKFMEENCTGIIEDQSIFDILKMDKDPMELQADLREFLEKRQDVATVEGQELMVLLRETFVVVSILMKFALEAKKQCSVQMREIRVLRQEITANHENYLREVSEKQAEFEEELNAESERREAAEAAVEEVTAILKENVMKSGQIPEILECIDHLGNFSRREVNEEVYEKTVERRLSAALNELSQAQSELTELKEKTTCEISQIEEQSKDIKEETQSLIAGKNEEIDKYKAHIDSLNRKLKQRTEELRRAQEENKEQAVTMSNLKASYAKKSAQMREEFTKVKQEMAAMLEKTTAEVAMREKRKRDVLKQKLKKTKEVADSLSSLIEEKDEQLKSVSAVNSQLVNDKKSKAEERRNMESEYQQSIASMREQLRQSSTKQMSTELENKLLASKLKAAEKKLAQEKAALESQSSLNVFSLEGELQSATESLREQFDEERLNFLREISHSLADVCPSSDNLDETSVLRNVHQAVDMVKQLQSEKSSLDREIRDVRRALNCPKGVNPAEIVMHLHEHVRAAESKIQRLNTEIQSLPRIQIKRTEDNGKEKEWEDWARNLYFSLTDGLPNIASFQAMRTAIEEAALSTDNVSTARKLDSLRVQKGLLQGNDLARRERTDLSLRELSLAVMACRRVLRLAGLVPSTLTFEKVDPPSATVSPIPAKNPSPIFSSFVE